MPSLADLAAKSKQKKPAATSILATKIKADKQFAEEKRLNRKSELWPANPSLKKNTSNTSTGSGNTKLTRLIKSPLVQQQSVASELKNDHERKLKHNYSQIEEESIKISINKWIANPRSLALSWIV